MFVTLHMELPGIRLSLSRYFSRGISVGGMQLFGSWWHARPWAVDA